MVEISKDAGGEKGAARPATPKPARRPRPPLPRLRRRAFHTAALASAFLLLAILILWPRSYFHYDRIAYRAGTGDNGGIYSWVGRLGASAGNYGAQPAGFSYVNYDSNAEPPWYEWFLPAPAGPAPDRRHYVFLACEYSVAFPESTFYPGRWITIPYSYLAILSAIMPAFWLLTRKRRRRANRLADGLCPLCGYDLRGHAAIPNPRCPECGSPAPHVEPA